MSQQSSEHGWEQLQEHIAGFLDQALRSDIQKIEYNRNLLPLSWKCPRNVTGAKQRSGVSERSSKGRCFLREQHHRTVERVNGGGA